MNRKTHLFYNSTTNGNDNQFITFDNYTEALTGDILVTDVKMFPSRFICCKIPSLTNNNKDEFIKNYIVGYYENKLAVLRDNLSNEQLTNYFNPLGYLIDTIKRYDENTEFCLISDIVEMDYNGTYTDIICTINPAKFNIPHFNEEQFENQISYSVENSSELYGWHNLDANSGIHSYIDDITPIYDSGHSYNCKNVINSVTTNLSPDEEVTFNIIIPLFDIKHINMSEETTIGDYPSEKDIPLGIYFCEKNISLKHEKKYNTNWSLLISMQFSPFPYSYDIFKDFDVDSSYVKDAYLTFAQILAKQANTIDLINKYNDMVYDLNQKINSFSTDTNTSNITNVDDINKEILNIKKTTENRFSNIENAINELRNSIELNKLKWTIKSSN